MKQRTMLLAAAALLALGTASQAQDAPLRPMPAPVATPVAGTPAPTPAAVWGSPGASAPGASAPCVSTPCDTCTECTSDRVGGCVVRLRGLRSSRQSGCGDCCSTSVACTSCGGGCAPCTTGCNTCTTGCNTCSSCETGCATCNQGCHRSNSFRSFIDWLCYHPVKNCDCDKRPNPCCTPPLYTFFLCQGCDSGCAIAGHSDCACEEDCTSCKAGRHARQCKTCDTCETCDACGDSKPKVWFELKCLKKYQ